MRRGERPQSPGPLAAPRSTPRRRCPLLPAGGSRPHAPGSPQASWPCTSSGQLAPRPAGHGPGGAGEGATEIGAGVGRGAAGHGGDVGTSSWSLVACEWQPPGSEGFVALRAVHGVGRGAWSLSSWPPSRSRSLRGLSSPSPSSSSVARCLGDGSLAFSGCRFGTTRCPISGHSPVPAEGHVLSPLNMTHLSPTRSHSVSGLSSGSQLQNGLAPAPLLQTPPLLGPCWDTGQGAQGPVSLSKAPRCRCVPHPQCW